LWNPITGIRHAYRGRTVAATSAAGDRGRWDGHSG
jgi:hypothetical protein